MAGTITLALRTAQSGLLANQQALDAVANNVSNVNTPNYSRKIVNMEQRVLAGSGAGVQVSDVTRSVDEGLIKSVRLELSSFHALNVQRDYYDRIQDLFGEPGENSSIAHVISEFENAIEMLAVSPDKTLEQSEFTRQGQQLTLSFQNMSDTIQDLRLQADKEIADVVTEINSLISDIGDYNDTIVRNKSIQADVTDLMDQRDAAVDRLSELVDVRYFYRDDGDIVVFTSGGRTLVDNIPATLTHYAASSISATTTHAEGDLGGIYVNNQVEGNDITNEILGGQLYGLIQQRDSVLTDLQAQIDELAVMVRDTVNQVHNRGVAFPGSQSATGSRRFVDTANAVNTKSQTIKLDPTNSADDVAVLLFDNSGNQQAATTLNAIMTGAGLSSRGAGDDWTIADLASNLESWYQSNGAAGAVVEVNSDGKFSIELNSSSVSFAFRDETATANGSTHEDAEIAFDADGDGTTDETVSGFSNFLGLNDFFVDNLGRNVHQSSVLSSGFTSSATTLRFVDGTTNLPLDPGGGNDVTLSIPSGSSLHDIATLISNNVTNITADVVPDGDGFRLRISHDDGIDFEITESGGTLLNTIDMDLANTRVAESLTVRSDILSSPSKVTRGTVQWDADLGTSGEYFTSSGDDSGIQALAVQFASSNSFKASGGLAALSVNFSEYGTSIVSRSASLADTNTDRSIQQETLTNSLQLKSDNFRGVNLDEEMASLIVFEQAYSASARLISVIQDMFDALEASIG